MLGKDKKSAETFDNSEITLLDRGVAFEAEEATIRKIATGSEALVILNSNEKELNEIASKLGSSLSIRAGRFSLLICILCSDEIYVNLEAEEHNMPIDRGMEEKR